MPITQFRTWHRLSIYRVAEGGEALNLSPMPGEPSRMSLTLDELCLLLVCNEFRTLEEHVVRFVTWRQDQVLAEVDLRFGELKQKALPFFDPIFSALNQLARLRVRRGLQNPSQIRDKLKWLCRQGLIVDSNRYSISKHDDQAEDDSLDVVGIVTAGNPSLVSRATLGVYTAFSERSVKPKVLVITGDQSGGSLSGLSSTDQSKVSFWGYQEKNTLINRLSAVGIPREVLEWTLIGLFPGAIDTGANRNCLHLLSAGRIVLSLDDDVVLNELYHRSQVCQQVSISSLGDPRSHVSWASLHEAKKSVRPVVGNIDSHLCGFLGWRLVNASAMKGDLVLEKHISDRALRLIAEKRVSKVSFVCPSLVGDSGMGWPTRLALVSRIGDVRLLNSSSDSTQPFTSRWCTRTVGNPVLSLSEFFMSTCYLFSNDDCLLPFLPSFRYQDGVYGYGLRVLRPGSLIAYSPLGIVHNPLSRASFPVSALATPVPRRLARILMGIVGPLMNPLYSWTSAEGCMAIAASCREVARLGDSSLREFLYWDYWSSSRNSLERIQERLSDPDQSEFIRKSLLDLMRQIEYRLRDPDSSFPTEAASTGLDGLKFTRIALGRFGDVIAHWPALWDYARKNCLLVDE